MTPAVKREYDQKPIIDPISKYPFDESNNYHRFERPLSSHYNQDNKEREDLIKKYSDYNRSQNNNEEEMRNSARGGFMPSRGKEE